MQITTVTSEAEFASLEDAWNAAADLATSSSVFHRHEWFAAAWAWRRLDSTLSLMLAETDGRIAGILPLIRSVDRGDRARCLELLTVPDTQLADLIAPGGDIAGAAEALAAELARVGDWDILRLDYLSPRGAVIEALVPALIRHGLRLSSKDRGSNPSVALEGAWMDYYNTRSRRLKKSLNLAANRLRRAGEIRIEWITSANCDESRFQGALDFAIDVSRRSWKRDTGNALDRPGPQAFIRTLSRAAYRRGWASIWLIFVNERVLAMEYQLIHEGNVHALRADFVADTEDTSPGSHLFRQLLERLFGCGLRRYYLGPGDNPYKQRWTNTGEPLRRVIVYNHTWRGRVAWLRDAVLKPALRSIRDRFRSKRPPALENPSDPSSAPDART